MHQVEVPRASAIRRSYIGLRDIQPYVNLPLTPKEESMLDGLAYEQAPDEDENGAADWDGDEQEREDADMGWTRDLADDAYAGEAAGKFVGNEQADAAASSPVRRKDTVTIEVKAEIMTGCESSPSLSRTAQRRSTNPCNVSASADLGGQPRQGPAPGVRGTPLPADLRRLCQLDAAGGTQTPGHASAPCASARATDTRHESHPAPHSLSPGTGREGGSSC
jgi:hypothetical protein